MTYACSPSLCNRCLISDSTARFGILFRIIIRAVLPDGDVVVEVRGTSSPRDGVETVSSRSFDEIENRR